LLLSMGAGGYQGVSFTHPVPNLSAQRRGYLRLA